MNRYDARSTDPYSYRYRRSDYGRGNESSGKKETGSVRTTADLDGLTPFEKRQITVEARDVPKPVRDSKDVGLAAIIKFPTIENGEVCITIEDAEYISLESMTVASILAGNPMEEDYANPRFGGEAIILALKCCKTLGEIKFRSSQSSKSKSDTNNNSGPSEVETKCKEVDKEAWVDDFSLLIDQYSLGMLHELVLVSTFLSTIRLTNLICQYIFDYLTFKDYRDFRKAFAFQFLLKPYFRPEDRWNMENMLDCMLELPTLDEIHTEFEDKIPFTLEELKLAESENKSLRVGGNLGYKTNKRSTEELLIKVEYIIRRLMSFQYLYCWMNNAYSNLYAESFAYLNAYFNDPSNNDIGELFLTLKPDSTLTPYRMTYLLERDSARKIADPSSNYEDIDAIKGDMDKIELEMAAEAYLQKRKAEESCEGRDTNWQNDHPHHKDKVFPHLTYFLENCYEEIYRVLGSLRGWMGPQEAQHKLRNWNIRNKTIFEHACDDEDVESEGLLSQESEADRQIIVASLSKSYCLAVRTAGDSDRVYESYQKLQLKMRQILHAKLLLLDEEILAFICKEKFSLYMKASEQGTRRSTISFAENKEEFERIKKETDQKFGDRGPDIEEAKKKYFLHYRKFHHAMVDETNRQMARKVEDSVQK